MFNVIDLFCGAGGLTEGFRQAGFRSILSLDKDPQALETFQYNHPETICIESDIRALNGKVILDACGKSPGNIDIICGGPPCQGYSLAGQRIADDPKNHLFKDFIRIISELEPRVVLFENVVGIMSMQKGAVLEAIFNEFKSIGYVCNAKVLNAVDYGVPQSRPRFILIAVPKGCESVKFPQPTHCSTVEQLSIFQSQNCVPYLSAWEALSDLPWIKPGEGQEEMYHSGNYSNDYQKSRKGTRKPGLIFNHRATKHSQNIQARYAAIPEGGGVQDIPLELQTKKRNVWKIDRFKPSRTVTCNHRTDILHPLIARGTTVREAARLQSFDDDYRFFGNLTRKAKWVTQDDQVGNAVPPLLAFAIAKEIKTYLANDSQERELSRLQT